MSWFQKLMCKWFKIGCPAPPPAPPGPSRAGLLYGYFGTQDGQIAATAPHVDIVHIGAWGDWTSPAGRDVMMADMVRWGHEAVSGGVNRLMFTLDWCLFTQTTPKKLLPEATAVQRLTAFFDRLTFEGLDTHAFAWYLVDEPNITENNLSETQLTTAIATVRSITSYTQLNNIPIAAVYGHTGSYPGVQLFDWTGFDDYGAPIFTNGAYNSFVSLLTAAQKTIILPGGGDPWREDPASYYNKAQADTRVVMIMPFKWFGTDGIGANGMAPTYTATGMRVKATTP